jgi:cytochrome P450
MPNALLGSMLDLRRDFLGTLERAMLDQGDVARVVVGPPGARRVLHVITHPDGIQHVLATNSRNYAKRNPFYEEVRAWLGDGVLTSEGDTWQRQRRIVQPLFTPRRVTTYVDVMAEEANRLVEELRPAAASSSTVDLHAMSMRFTLRVVGRLLFGDDVEDIYETLDRAFPVINEAVVARGQQPIRLPRQWPTPRMRRATVAQRDLFEVVDRLVARHRDADGSPDLVTLLQHARDPETGGRLNNREIRDQVLIFLLAGHETTAIALTFALHLLGHHGAVQDRVRTEVNRVVPSWPPSADDVQRLMYTWAVVQEAMRLYPPAPNTGRLAIGPDTVLNHRIDTGAIVVICIWALHRNPALWHDPQLFDPARFAPDAVAGRHRYAYVPFGGGPRACLGALFARLEATVAVAAVTRAYRLRTDPVQPALTTGITLHPRRAVPCTVAALAASDR